MFVVGQSDLLSGRCLEFDRDDKQYRKVNKEK